MIDEARTPLIISGEAEQANSDYIRADRFVKTLSEDKSDDDVDDDEDYGDYKIDWPTKTISLTRTGIEKACKHFGLRNLYDVENQKLVSIKLFVLTTSCLRTLTTLFKMVKF